MPTVSRSGGVRIMIYANDHRPAHVHVIAHGCEAVFNLGCPMGPVEERENYGFSRRELKQLRLALSEILDHLCRAWEEIHGIA